MSVFRRSLWVVFTLLLLTGCRTTTVYSQLEERQANEMLSALLKSGFSAEKVDGGKNGFSIKVDESELMYVLDVLEAKGLPNRNYESLGTVFASDGVMSSATQEKARYLYATSQELMNTFNLFDGVIESRVHLVMKEKDQLTGEETPASAAVFLRYRPDANMTGVTSKVQQIILQSIPSIDRSNISVTLFEAKEQIQIPNAPSYKTVLGMSVSPSSQRDLFYYLFLIGIGGFCLGIVLIVMLLRHQQMQKKSRSVSGEGS